MLCAVRPGTYSIMPAAAAAINEATSSAAHVGLLADWLALEVKRPIQTRQGVLDASPSQIVHSERPGQRPAPCSATECQQEGPARGNPPAADPIGSSDVRDPTGSGLAVWAGAYTRLTQAYTLSHHPQSYCTLLFHWTKTYAEGYSALCCLRTCCWKAVTGRLFGL